MAKLLLAFALVLAFATPLTAQQRTVVLRAKPDTRVVAERGDATEEVLVGRERLDNLVVIAKVGPAYYWQTRDDRELIYRRSGVYHIFIDPSGGGWVKVLDQSSLPASLRIEGPTFQFFENVSSGLTTYTYWGSASSFNP